MDAPLSRLKLWLDPEARPGPENMAVDDWLIETCDAPVLRVYGWEGRWGSLGCFCCFDQTMEIGSNVRWVRRSTGGGIVDHQFDWTYTLVIPETEKLARIRGSESYQVIHNALHIALIDRLNRVLGDDSASELGGVCFQKPVQFDVVDGVGNKIAGAGQRRRKEGLLHQGSVVGRCESVDSIDRSNRLAEALAERWEPVDLEPPEEVIGRKVEERYGLESWTKRR